MAFTTLSKQMTAFFPSSQEYINKGTQTGKAWKLKCFFAGLATTDEMEVLKDSAELGQIFNYSWRLPLVWAAGKAFG